MKNIEVKRQDKHVWLNTTTVEGCGLTYVCRNCGQDFPDADKECWRYEDNDSLRPEVDERAKQELGFGLVEPYDRGDA